MAFSVSILPKTFRADSTILPIITVTDDTGIPYVKLGEWQYLSLAAQNPLTVIPPNKTESEVVVTAKDCFNPFGDWDLEADITDAADGTLSRGGAGASYAGAVYNATPLNQSNCSIQAKATSTNLSTGISLQDASDTASHNYDDVTVRHSIILGQNGQGSIRENGVLVSTNSLFKYKVGDTVMIEVIDDRCRYYLIDEDGNMELLRKTTSKLTENAQGEVLLYFAGSELEDVFLWSATKDTDTFENIGVAHFRDDLKYLYWQAWQNQKASQSIGELLEMADRRTQVTYPNSLKRLFSWSLTPKAFDLDQYWLFQEFVAHHDIGKEFIFRDEARKKDGEATEYWVKFTQGFVDATRNGCQFEQSATIVQDFRNDYQPRWDDEIPPEVAITSGNDVLELTGTASDDILLVSVQIYVDGFKYGDIFKPDLAGNWTFSIDEADLDEGVHSVYAVATDYAGNTTQSNTITITIGSSVLSGEFTLGGEEFTLGGEPFTLGV